MTMNEFIRDWPSTLSRIFTHSYTWLLRRIRSNLRTRVCTQADWNMSLPSTGDDESVHINKDHIQAVIGCMSAATIMDMCGEEKGFVLRFF